MSTESPEPYFDELVDWVITSSPGIDSSTTVNASTQAGGSHTYDAGDLVIWLGRKCRELDSSDTKLRIQSTNMQERVVQSERMYEELKAANTKLEATLVTSRMDAINLRLERDEEKRHAEQTESLFQVQVGLRESDLARVAELEEELRQLREAVDRQATGEGLATMEVTLKDGSRIVGQGVRILPPPREGSG